MRKIIYSGCRCDLVRMSKGVYAIEFDGGNRYGPFHWAEALDWYRRHKS